MISRFLTAIYLTLFPINCHKSLIWLMLVENLDFFGENSLKLVENIREVVKKFGKIHNENFV